ncbi:MAG: tRNA (N6-isopentenyl adenosine(37)-C2)-methylthiotransferase MiaB [Gemmatimonadota bacterium]|nr:tRNA (N6-isopentenyl adenosine(37)-C2)-methylthiotransferase MiaB [Gemmatimonadota bacterium]
MNGKTTSEPNGDNGAVPAGGAGGRRAYVETYGCQMNIADGELMEGVLEKQGYEIVGAPEEADVILVNTCAIREHAEERVLGRVGQLSGLRHERPGLVLGVTGCMAQRMGEMLLGNVKAVDLVMGPDGYRQLGDAVDEIVHRRGPRARRNRRLAVLDLSLDENYQGLEQRRRSDVTAWVPVQRGCNHRCTFCIVPYVRGPEKNREPDDVIAEIRRLAGDGITEVTLLGQTVNSYRHGDWSFARLLRAVARVDGIRRVRFTSPHPVDVTEDLVEVMATEPAVCEQFHLPLQSGSNAVLKRMVRRYTKEIFREKVAMLRTGIPDIALSTDVIAAFPGETDDDFEQTISFLSEIRFDEAFTYRYSERPGTPATRFPREWFVPENVARDRLSRLIGATRFVQAEINQDEVGRVEKILVERRARSDGMVLGRTRRNKAVVVRGGPDDIGRYRTVRLVDTTGATFIGERLLDEEISHAPVAPPE